VPLTVVVTNTPSEQWFVAVLVFESRIVEDPDDDASVDVQFRLVRAADAESAYERALSLGRRGRVSYENADGNTCEWAFAGLEDLRRVDDQDLGHGAEVYGFIEQGAASRRVVPKEELTGFRSRPAAE
jgi:hypothetical protein